MVKLKRLKINSFRNVRPGCDLRFSDRFNILLGPNGAGKTTLLNFISHVLRSGVPEAGDPFSIEVEVAIPGGALLGTISAAEERDPSTLAALGLDQTTIAADRTDTLNLPAVRIQIVLSDAADTAVVQTEREGFLEIRPGSKNLLLANASFVNFLGGILSTTLVASTLPAAPRIISFIRNAYRFDESLDVFRALIGRVGAPDPPEREGLRPRVDALVQSLSGDLLALGPAEGIVSGSLLEELRNHISGNIVDVSIEHTKLTFLSETVRLLKLRSVETKLELTEKTMQKPGVERLHFGNLKFWFTRHDGSVFLDHQLSYGQKRLFAFLYYLDANPSIVIADELVNGLHHAWIEECIKAIGDRQAFLTSQNPLLLDHLWFESVEQVKETFIVCRTEVVGDREQMIWRNLTDDEADMFYSAYRVGIEHVGEILRTRGLW